MAESNSLRSACASPWDTRASAWAWATVAPRATTTVAMHMAGNFIPLWDINTKIMGWWDGEGINPRKKSGNPLHRHAAVDAQDLPGDVAGQVAGEEQHGGGDLPGLAHPLERKAVDDPFDDLGVDLRRHIGVDEARRDRVDAHAAGAELARGGLGERDEAALGRAVVRLAGVAQHARDARDVDDASRLGAHEEPARGLDEEEG